MLRQARGGLGQIELDDFRRAGADEEEQLDVGTAREQFCDDAVDLVLRIEEARQIALLHDGGRKARLSEDHHARRRLQQMRAGARADDQEKRVLDLAVHPHDAGEAAEDFALAALVNDRRRGAACAFACENVDRAVHCADPASVVMRDA